MASKILLPIGALCPLFLPVLTTAMVPRLNITITNTTLVLYSFVFKAFFHFC